MMMFGIDRNEMSSNWRRLCMATIECVWEHRTYSQRQFEVKNVKYFVRIDAVRIRLACVHRLASRILLRLVVYSVGAFCVCN